MALNLGRVKNGRNLFKNEAGNYPTEKSALFHSKRFCPKNDRKSRKKEKKSWKLQRASKEEAPKP